MATEVERLVLEVVNAQEHTRLTEQLNREVAAYDAVVAAARLMGQTNAQIAASTNVQAQAIIGLRQQTQALGVQSGNMRGVGLNLAYALQDVTSVSNNLSQQIMAVSNNLQMMAVNAGLSTKWIVGLTAAVAALQIIAQNWDKIKEAITGVSSEWSKTVEGMKKSLDDLEKKKFKVGVDFMDIEALESKIHVIESAIRAVNELTKQQTQEGKATAKSFEDAFVDAVDAAGNRLSGSDIKEKMIAALIPEASKLSDELYKVITENQKHIDRINSTIGDINAQIKGGAISMEGGQDRINIQLEARKEFEQRITDARTKIGAKGGLAEQLLGTKMDEAKHGNEAQQKAATEFLAQYAEKTPEVQARIKELPTLGKIESSQQRTQKEIQTAQSLQGSHIKQAILAEEKGNQAIADEHWAAAEKEGEQAQKLLSEMDAIYNKNKAQLTERSRRNREIEQDQIREMARQVDERTHIAQNDQIINSLASKERDRKQGILIDQIKKDEEFRIEVTGFAAEAQQKGLLGNQAIAYVQTRIRDTLRQRINQLETFVPAGERAGAGGLAPVVMARGLAIEALPDLVERQKQKRKELDAARNKRAGEAGGIKSKLREEITRETPQDVMAATEQRAFQISMMQEGARKNKAKSDLDSRIRSNVTQEALRNAIPLADAQSMGQLAVQMIDENIVAMRTQAKAYLEAAAKEAAAQERRAVRPVTEQDVRRMIMQDLQGQQQGQAPLIPLPVAGLQRNNEGGNVAPMPGRAANPENFNANPPGQRFNSIAPTPEPQVNNQASIQASSAAIDQSIKTQELIAQQNSAIAALQSRIGRSESNITMIARQTRSLFAANTESGPTAQDSGYPT